LLFLASVLALWQFLPRSGWLRHQSPVFDPFFVSSPSRIVVRLGQLLGITGGSSTIWPRIGDTVEATLLGVATGFVLGAAFGLLLSASHAAQRVLSPFITIANATPRIALVPVFVIIVGPSMTLSIVTCVTVVFFVIFYNAYSGATSVPAHVIANSHLLGAWRRETVRHVRLPYALAWTVAALPNAISFGIVTVVTAEILGGQRGMGQLLLTSITTVDSTLTFAVVVVLAAVGALLVGVSDLVSRRALHWWERT
jgi:NitT/TauT family transport system permease protein